MKPKKQANSKQTMPQVDKGLMKKMNVLEAKLSRIIENRCLDENDDVDAWFEETFGCQDCSNLSPNSVTVNICLQIGFVHKCFTKDSSKAEKYANASLKIVQDALRIGKRDILTADVVWKFQTIYVRTKVLDGLEGEVIANWKPILDEIKNDHPSESLEDLSMLINYKSMTLATLKLYEEAIEAQKKCMKINGNIGPWTYMINTQHIYILGLLQDLMGDFDKAYDTFKKFSERNVTDGSEVGLQTHCKFFMGKYEYLKHNYQNALDILNVFYAKFDDKVDPLEHTMIGEWRSGGFQGLKDSTFYK